MKLYHTHFLQLLICQMSSELSRSLHISLPYSFSWLKVTLMSIKQWQTCGEGTESDTVLLQLQLVPGHILVLFLSLNFSAFALQARSGYSPRFSFRSLRIPLSFSEVLHTYLVFGLVENAAQVFAILLYRRGALRIQMTLNQLCQLQGKFLHLNWPCGR